MKTKLEEGVYLRMNAQGQRTLEINLNPARNEPGNEINLMSNAATRRRGTDAREDARNTRKVFGPGRPPATRADLRPTTQGFEALRDRHAEGDELPSAREHDRGTGHRAHRTLRYQRAALPAGQFSMIPTVSYPSRS